MGLLFFLISLSDNLLLEYKNAFDSWILSLYPAVFPNSLIRLSTFMVESIRFSMKTIISSANSDSFTSSIPIWIPFISFSCLITVARTSNTMLNTSGESEHPILSLMLVRKWCRLWSAVSVGVVDEMKQIHTDYRSPVEKKGWHGHSLKGREP